MGPSFRKRVLGLREQGAHIRLVCPGFSYVVRNGFLHGRGIIQPTPLCQEYQFSLSYSLGNDPEVSIVAPRLRGRHDQTKIPHTYSDQVPCLYRPGIDWSSQDSIATTIIPWLGLWLFYYEIWHATGPWLGGGEHPTPTVKPEAGRTHKLGVNDVSNSQP